MMATCRRSPCKLCALGIASNLLPKRTTGPEVSADLVRDCTRDVHVKRTVGVKARQIEVTIVFDDGFVIPILDE